MELFKESLKAKLFASRSWFLKVCGKFKDLRIDGRHGYVHELMTNEIVVELPLALIAGNDFSVLKLLFWFLNRLESYTIYLFLYVVGVQTKHNIIPKLPKSNHAFGWEQLNKNPPQNTPQILWFLFEYRSTEPVQHFENISVKLLSQNGFEH